MDIKKTEDLIDEALKDIIAWTLEEDENWNRKQIEELDFKSKRGRTGKREDLN